MLLVTHSVLLYTNHTRSKEMSAMAFVSSDDMSSEDDELQDVTSSANRAS